MNNSVNCTFIGKVSSPYQEKFAIPRQPGLVSAAKGAIELIGAANNSELVRGLEQFSHIWVLFVFHETQNQSWKPLVRPPRLGGNEKLGVLATRTTFRPNPIGMSVVTLDSITNEDGKVTLNISGLDLLDKTPVLDIKPYIPYCDAVNNAQGGFAHQEPKIALSICFSEQTLTALATFTKEYAELKPLITQVLAQDPRPAYKQNKADDKLYGMKLFDLNIQWRMRSLNEVLVVNIEKAGN